MGMFGEYVPHMVQSTWADRENLGKGIQYTFRFRNGYGASVISSPFSYGGMSGLFELGVLKFVTIPEDDLELPTLPRPWRIPKIWKAKIQWSLPSWKHPFPFRLLLNDWFDYWTVDPWRKARMEQYDNTPSRFNPMWSLTYDTPITEDVLGYLKPEQVGDILATIEALPPHDKYEEDYFAAIRKL